MKKLGAGIFNAALTVLAPIFFALLIAYPISQLYAAYDGVAHHLGAWWATACIASAFFGFTLPVTVGAFFGATNVWGWHWALAILFVAPGLCVAIPGAIFSVSAVLLDKFRTLRERQSNL